MARFRIHTNWTNSVSVVHEFALEDLADAAVRDKLKWAMSDPERLLQGEPLGDASVSSGSEVIDFPSGCLFFDSVPEDSRDPY